MRLSSSLGLHIYVYIYIHTCTYIHTHTGLAYREASRLLDYGHHTTLPSFAHEIFYLQQYCLEILLICDLGQEILKLTELSFPYMHKTS